MWTFKMHFNPKEKKIPISESQSHTPNADYTCMHTAHCNLNWTRWSAENWSKAAALILLRAHGQKGVRLTTVILRKEKDYKVKSCWQTEQRRKIPFALYMTHTGKATDKKNSNHKENQKRSAETTCCSFTLQDIQQSKWWPCSHTVPYRKCGSF